MKRGENIDLEDYMLKKKAGEGPEEGLKKAKEEIKKYNETSGPVEDYAEELKDKRQSGDRVASKAYDEYQKDLEWLGVHMGKLSGYLRDRFGLEQIELQAYIMEVSGEDHECYKIKSRFNNTTLDVHEHGLNCAFYSTFALDLEAMSESTLNFELAQELLAREIFKEIIDNMPDHQLEIVNQIQPNFITDYTIDSDPSFCVQIELDLLKILKNPIGCGVYSDLFLTQADKFPYFPFQPIYADNEKEKTLIIIPADMVFDGGIFRETVANRLNVDKEKVRLHKLYNLGMDIEELEYSVAPHAAHNIRIRPQSSEDINAEMAKVFLDMCEIDVRIVQGAGGGLGVKGRKGEEFNEGVKERIKDFYGKMTGSDVYFALFGLPREHKYIDPSIQRDLHEELQGKKKYRLG